MTEPAPALDAVKIALKPCPCCGGAAAPGTIRYSRQTARENGWAQTVFHSVSCQDCGVSNVGPVGFDTPEAAAEAWNTRAALDAVAGAVAVKPLAWRDRHANPTRLDDLVADSVVGQYVIRPSAGRQLSRLWVPGCGYNDALTFNNPEAAKTAAQADHEARIHSALVAAPPAAREDVHPDDLAVDRFAAAMKAKLAQKRAEGRGGWEDKTACSAMLLSALLRAHVAKGDPVDVANFAMMLHQRGERIVLKTFDLSGEIATLTARAEKAEATVNARDAEVARLREALTEEKYWHEGEDHTLSKSGRCDADYYWRRSQHREQIEAIDAALTPVTRDAGGE